MRGIRKEFPGVVANDDVTFDVRRGEVHALLGENGAGKSTLMNILYGLYRPDAGEIRLNGKPVSFSSAREAIQAGIGMVHQHFMLIPVMTVAENIVLGTEPRKGVLLDEAVADQRVADMARTFRFEVDPEARVEDISVGQQQRVEIMKALYRNADLLILDEPTAVLTPQEASDLFEILRNLQREGLSIIFISHKLNEVLEIADPRLSHTTARAALDAGIGHIPEDRQRRGLVLEFSIAENIALHDYAKPPDARLGWLFPRRMVDRAKTLIREFDVRGGGPFTRAGGLSGGNQQKLVAAREIARDPKVLIAARPTRGLDVGAIAYLHRRLVQERNEGRAILLVSLELEEILSLSDRILVVYEGEIVGEHTGEVSEDEIGLEMLGGREQAAA